MKLISVFSVITFYWNVENINTQRRVPQSVEDYYWRDFNGLVPSDAIVAGQDLNELNTYIGQFSVLAEYNQHKSKIHVLPATVKKGPIAVYAPYNHRVIYSNETNNEKILCSGSSRSFQWGSPNETFGTNCRFVVTGYEDLSPMYTGKVVMGKETITGKIFADSSSHYPGLIIPLSNGQEFRPDDYEILTYC